MNKDLSFPINHIGIAVRNIENAAKRYSEDFFYSELEPREKIVEFGAEVAFLIPERSLEGATALELISPLDKDSSIHRFLEKRGEGMHHICFSVPDVQAEQKRLSGLGYRFTSDKPRKGAHNGLVIFIHPKSADGVLIELREQLKS